MVKVGNFDIAAVLKQWIPRYIIHKFYLFIFQIYSPHLNSAPPRWVHFAHGLLLFLYQVGLNTCIAVLANFSISLTLTSIFILFSPVFLAWWQPTEINFTYVVISCLESWSHLSTWYFPLLISWILIIMVLFH